MSAKSSKRPLRSLTAHEKLDAIRRVHDGESKASVARDIGVPESTLRGWCKNEDKISYLSRQSSPETDESLDHMSHKKPKLDESQPFNLSMKNHTTFSSNPVTTGDTIDSKILLNLNVPTSETTPKSTNNLTERDRNRAELARLSVELGLNRPEMFIPSLTNSLNLTDFNTNISLLAQWNTLLAQQQQIKNLQSNKSGKVLANADSSKTVSSSNIVLTNTEPSTEQSLPKDAHSVQDSVWYWLKSQQSVLNMSQMSTTSVSNSSSTNGISSPIVTPLPSSSNPCLNGITSDQSSWFWKWYKQFAYKEQETKPILYQQLTKEPPQKEPIIPVTTSVDQQNAENLSMRDNIDNRQKENGCKVRSVLDNLLFNNNNNDNLLSEKKQETKEDDETISQSEAVEHGEKFLKWLESCSDPSVTAVQIMQFKTLLNNVKTGVDRKNCDLQNKAKVKRK